MNLSTTPAPLTEKQRKKRDRIFASWKWSAAKARKNLEARFKKNMSIQGPVVTPKEKRQRAKKSNELYLRHLRRSLSKQTIAHEMEELAKKHYPPFKMDLQKYRPMIHSPIAARQIRR